MILYHSSPFIVSSPDILHSRDNLDFGKGFYLTLIDRQALNYAQRFIRRNGNAYLNRYMLDDSISGFKLKTFDSYDEEWLDFVAENRKGVSETVYDLIEGGIANDKVFNTIDLYFSGYINKEEALGRLAYEKPNHQICITSQELIDRHLHFIDATKIVPENQF